MYLYRALNDYDIDNINEGKGIKANCYNDVISESLSCVIKHISHGSDYTKGGNWISTCKRLDICVQEYAIPQNGKYNKEKKRRDVAVIDVSSWFGDKTQIGNYTMFVDEKFNKIKNLCMEEDYKRPLNEKCGTCNRSINIDGKSKGWTSEELKQQIEQYKKALELNPKIKYGMIDCSHPNNTGSEIPSIHELSVMELGGEKNESSTFKSGILGENGSAIVNGSAYRSQEVLFLNEIPKHMIKCILSPIEQDILFMIEEEYRDKVIDKLSNNNYYDKSVIDFLNDETDIEIQYKELINRRKNNVLDIINNDLGLGQYVKENGEIPEECGLFVKELTQQYSIDKREIYDLLAVRYNNKLYKYDEVVDNLSGELKDVLIKK